MYIPKRYGEGKLDTCPFCGKRATILNTQKVPVCIEHKKNELNNLKCACGSYIDMRQGKFGVFFTCIKCGAVSLSKALELNTIEKTPTQEKTQIQKTENKKIFENKKVIRSDDPMFFD